jgi:hypothetical protein
MYHDQGSSYWDDSANVYDPTTTTNYYYINCITPPPPYPDHITSSGDFSTNTTHPSFATNCTNISVTAPTSWTHGTTPPAGAQTIINAAGITAGTTPGPYYAPTPALLAHNHANNGGSGTSLTVTLSTYAGNPILIGVFNCDGASCINPGAGSSAHVTGITDGRGGTCSLVSGTNNEGSATPKFIVSGWICKGGSAGSDTLTVTCSSGVGGCFYLTIHAAEFSVITGTGEVGNVTTTNTPASSSSLATNGSTTSTNEVIFGYNNVNSPTTCTPNQTAIDGSGTGACSEYQIGSTAGTYTDSFSFSGSDIYSTLVFAAK